MAPLSAWLMNRPLDGATERVVDVSAARWRYLPGFFFFYAPLSVSFSKLVQSLLVDCLTVFVLFRFLVPAEVVPVPASGLIVVRKGEPVTLACNVTGNPEPVTTWTREV